MGLIALIVMVLTGLMTVVSFYSVSHAFFDSGPVSKSKWLALGSYAAITLVSFLIFAVSKV